jgi:hypothetical protein
MLCHDGSPSGTIKHAGKEEIRLCSSFSNMKSFLKSICRFIRLSKVVIAIFQIAIAIAAIAIPPGKDYSGMGILLPF